MWDAISLCISAGAKDPCPQTLSGRAEEMYLVRPSPLITSWGIRHDHDD